MPSRIDPETDLRRLEPPTEATCQEPPAGEARAECICPELCPIDHEHE